MNPHRTYEDNMAVLNKVLTQRTRMALSRRNIEFVLKTRTLRWKSWLLICSGRRQSCGIFLLGQK